MDTKLVMPNNYAVIDTEEMEYIDGGGDIINGVFNAMLNVPSLARVIAIVGYNVVDTVKNLPLTQSIVSGIKNFKSAIWGGITVY